jgi:hypothetical protein
VHFQQEDAKQLRAVKRDRGQETAEEEEDNVTTDNNLFLFQQTVYTWHTLLLIVSLIPHYYCYTYIHMFHSTTNQQHV